MGEVQDLHEADVQQTMTMTERITHLALGIRGEYAALLPEVCHRALKANLGRTM